MVNLNTDMIDFFVEKQEMGIEDKRMQLGCIEEELSELISVSLIETEREELKEAIDVLVTVFVYLKILGFKWSEVEKEFERKMVINMRKPIREGKGTKVKKE